MFNKKIDATGRLIIPKEIRDKYKWNSEDMLEIIPTGDDKHVIIKKMNKECLNCNSEKNLISIGNITLCKRCLKKFD